MRDDGCKLGVREASCGCVLCERLVRFGLVENDLTLICFDLEYYFISCYN